jgi:hypothetical protein
VRRAPRGRTAQARLRIGAGQHGGLLPRHGNSEFLETARWLSRTSQPHGRVKIRESRQRDTADHQGRPLARLHRCSCQPGGLLAPHGYLGSRMVASVRAVAARVTFEYGFVTRSRGPVIAVAIGDQNYPMAAAAQAFRQALGPGWRGVIKRYSASRERCRCHTPLGSGSQSGYWTERCHEGSQRKSTVYRLRGGCDLRDCRREVRPATRPATSWRKSARSVLGWSPSSPGTTAPIRSRQNGVIFGRQRCRNCAGSAASASRSKKLSATSAGCALTEDVCVGAVAAPGPSPSGPLATGPTRSAPRSPPPTYPGHTASSSRICGSAASATDPLAGCTYCGGLSAASARRAVFRPTPSLRAIARTGIPSARCSRRTSAQSSRLITPHYQGGGSSFPPARYRIHP